MDNQSLIDRRSIRIFISSTFKDMVAERDYLMKKVFPRLQKTASERGVSVLPLDLRWGITQSEAQSGKVLEICLREIDNSRPFFIGILGDRYGWCPPSDELRKNPYLREEYGNWLAKDLGRELSVTEIEIQYGILRRSEPQHAYFYERTGGIKDPRVKRLKEEIVSDGRYPLTAFSKPDELGDLIERDFIALLDSLYPEQNLSSRETELMAQKGFRASLCESYFPDPGLFKRLDDFLSGDEKELVVCGESGLGKSALVANWLQTLPYSWNVVYHSVGLTGKTDLDSVEGAIVGQITGDPEMKVEEALRLAASKGPLLLVLDGIDNLSEERNARRLMWLGEVPDGAKFIFTSTDAENLRNASELRLTPLDVERRKKMVTDYLRGFGKKLSPEQLDRIASADLSANTNVLKSLLDELLAFGVFEQLDDIIDYYLGAASTADFFTRIIRRKERDFGRKTVEQALSLIAFSSKGISETEILSISGMNRLALSQFLCSFRKHLTVSGGLLNFRHNHVTKAVRDEYAGKETKTREAIIEFFANYPKADPRALDELPTQYFKLGKAKELYNYLSSILVFGKLYARDMFLLGKYWRYLILKGYKADVYLNQGWVDDPSESDHHKMVVLHGIGFILSRVAGDYDAAEKYFEASLKVNGEGEDKLVARAWYELAVIHLDHKDYQKAIQEANKAYSLYKQCGLEDSAYTATCCTALGRYYNEYALDYESAFKYYNLGLKLSIKYYGEFNNETIVSYCNLANALCMLKRFDAAEINIEKALAQSIMVFGEVHETTFCAYSTKGVLLFYTQHYVDALEYFKKALELSEELFGPRHGRTLLIKEWIGICYRFSGDWFSALFLYKNLLKDYLKAGVNGVTVVDQYLSISVSYLNLGLARKSRHVALKGALYGEDFIESESDDAAKALLLFKVGQLNYYAMVYDDALQQLQESISFWEKSGQPTEYAGLSYNFIGLIHLQRNKQLARECFQKAHENLETTNPSMDAVVLQNIKSTL